MRRNLSHPLIQCARGALLALVALGMSSCAGSKKNASEVRVSIRDQKVALVENGKAFKVYPCSTSKYGIGDRPGTYATPVGNLRVASKIGAGAPAGSAFHGRQRTGEIVKPNTPGRDIIVSRILRLDGLDPQNRRTYDRGIYIHGTPEEKNIGRPASYGCVRMKSTDVIELFDQVPVGTPVKIVTGNLGTASKPIEASKELAAAGVSTPAVLGPAKAPEPILPPIQKISTPGQSATASKLVAKNGKERLGPAVVSAPTKSSKKQAQN
jgi:L,D-transpeptidase catalytic domain